MHRNLVVLCLVLCAASTARAQPRVIVEPSVPFSASALQQAIELRGGSERTVRVSGDGDAVIVVIGDVHRVVELADTDPTNAARIVAIIITAGGDESREAVVVRDNADAPAMLPVAGLRPPRLAMRAAIAAMRDDGGNVSPSLNGALTYAVRPSVRIAAGLFFGEMAGYAGVAKNVRALRLGVEGRAGALALELGAQVGPERDCAGIMHSGSGVYGVARIYVPMDYFDGQFVVEGGGYYVEDQVAGCKSYEPVSYDSQALHLGFGIEWPL